MPGDGNGVVYAMYGDLTYAQSIYLLGGWGGGGGVGVGVGVRKPPTGSDKC